MASQVSKQTLDYKQAGVDIEAGNTLVDQIKPIVKKTHGKGVLGQLGGFGALFEIPLADYKTPVLVSGTDGVGTKLMLAHQMNQHGTIGIDLVAMCVNDIIVQGAKPLFFLDYYATGQLDVETAKDVITGIAKGCELSGAALIGGETAEMPGMYQAEDYDLAGFCVGIADKSKVIDGQNVKVGDQLIALPSSGPHSNGFSLIRKIIEISGVELTHQLNGESIGDLLLKPTSIYVKTILSLLESIQINAISHITGGGLLENIPRVLPRGTCAKINSQSWQWPDIFKWLQTEGNVSNTEMHRTFNCGVGMILCVSPSDLEQALTLLNNDSARAWRIGEIETSIDDNSIIIE